MKTLIVLTGAPGSGKSTWTKNYLLAHKNTYVVSSDAIRFEITGCFDNHSRQKEVWELFANRIHEYATNDDSTVILDALCDLNSLRIKYVKDNPEFDKYVLVYFPRTFEYIQKYNKMRPKEVWVPDDILESLYKKFEKPNDEALGYFDEVIIVEQED